MTRLLENGLSRLNEYSVKNNRRLSEDLCAGLLHF